MSKRPQSVAELPQAQESRAVAEMLKPGDRLSRISQLVVVDTMLGGSPEGPVLKYHMRNEHGFEYWIDGKIIESEMYSADHTQGDVQKVSQTSIALRLMSSRDAIFKVCFTKKDGSERILRGKYISHDPVFGSSRVVDLDLVNPPNSPENDCIRQVRHDQIKWLNLRGVRYEVK